MQVLAGQVAGQLRGADEVLTALSVDDQDHSPNVDVVAIHSHGVLVNL